MSKLWVFLADPEDFGWNELERDGEAVWDGVKNARAQQNLRSTSPGDRIMLYHTAPDKAVIGIAEVTGGARPDPKAVDRVVVDVRPVKRLKRPVTLKELKADPTLKEISFVKMPRVAVQLITRDQWDRLLEVAGGPA